MNLTNVWTTPTAFNNFLTSLALPIKIEALKTWTTNLMNFWYVQHQNLLLLNSSPSWISANVSGALWTWTYEVFFKLSNKVKYYMLSNSSFNENTLKLLLEQFTFAKNETLKENFNALKSQSVIPLNGENNPNNSVNVNISPNNLTSNNSSFSVEDTTNNLSQFDVDKSLNQHTKENSDQDFNVIFETLKLDLETEIYHDLVKILSPIFAPFSISQTSNKWF